MKGIIIGIVIALTAVTLAAKTAPHVPLGIVSDWTHHHVLFPESRNPIVTARIQRDPRWEQNWYLRHPEAWWPEHQRGPGKTGKSGGRDWSVSLGSGRFGQMYDFAFDIAPETGYGSLNTSDNGGGEFLATAGSLTVTGGNDIGTYPMYPGGPAQTTSPLGSFYYDNLLFPLTNPPLDVDGLLFTTPGLEINIWGNSAGNYSYYDSPSDGYYPTALTEDGTFNLNVDPSGGQTFPSTFVSDVTGTPSCTNDFVVIGLLANPSGSQANIMGLNNLYSSQGASTPTPTCGITGPKVMFAYASGSGQIPASVNLSLSGTQIAYVENLLTGSSYFHVLTIGTTTNEGTSATAPVVPGTGGSNAVDQRVLLSPDGGTTNQSSTNAAFIDYANDVAYVTTYSTVGSSSGYLYKIGNIFNASATPTITWKVPITAVPSSPVYDSVSNKVFFADSNGSIDYVTDTDTSTPPTVVYGTVLASGTTSENPVVVDSTNQMVYGSFNSNGTNALIVQAPIGNMAGAVSVPVGAASTTYTSPYPPDFNNAFFGGSGTPLLYVAGTGTGTIPTLYSVGFNGSGVMNSVAASSAALTSGGIADSSFVSEFYNYTLNEDFLFVGVTNHCIATTGGGSAGCVMSLDITSGFPTVGASTPALAAAGGTTGIVVDGDSNLPQAANIYYGTKTGATLVKATQVGLN